MNIVKQVAFSITFLFFTQLLCAQAPGNGSYHSPTIYIGGGVGVNMPGGMIGVMFEVPVNHKISFSAAAGSGSWGTKLTGTILVNTRPTALGSSLGMGFSYASGLQNFDLEMSVKPNTTKMVTLNLHQAYAVNLNYNYAWKIGRKCKLTLHTGYSVGLSSNNFELVTEDDVKEELTDQSKLILNMMSPGGLIIGTSFMFGL